MLNLLSHGEAFSRLHLAWWAVIGLYYLTGGLVALIWTAFDPATATRRRYIFQCFLALLWPICILDVMLYPGESWVSHSVVILLVSSGLGVFYGRMAWKVRLIPRRSMQNDETEA